MPGSTEQADPLLVLDPAQWAMSSKKATSSALSGGCRQPVIIANMVEYAIPGKYTLDLSEVVLAIWWQVAVAVAFGTAPARVNTASRAKARVARRILGD